MKVLNGPEERGSFHQVRVVYLFEDKTQCCKAALTRGPFLLCHAEAKLPIPLPQDCSDTRCALIKTFGQGTDHRGDWTRSCKIKNRLSIPEFLNINWKLSNLIIWRWNIWQEVCDLTWRDKVDRRDADFLNSRCREEMEIREGQTIIQGETQPGSGVKVLTTGGVSFKIKQQIQTRQQQGESIKQILLNLSIISHPILITCFNRAIRGKQVMFGHHSGATHTSQNQKTRNQKTLQERSMLSHGTVH